MDGTVWISNRSDLPYELHTNFSLEAVREPFMSLLAPEGYLSHEIGPELPYAMMANLPAKMQLGSPGRAPQPPLPLQTAVISTMGTVT